MPEAIFEIGGKQSALVGGAEQLLGDVRTVGVRCTHVPVLCHLPRSFANGPVRLWHQRRSEHDRDASLRFVHPWCEELPPAQVDPPAELIDARELARRIGISRATVYANARRYGAIKLGDGPNAPLRFDYAALLASLPRVGRQPVEILVPSSPDRLAEEGLRRVAAARGLPPELACPKPGRS